MGPIEFESNNWNWTGGFYPQLFGIGGIIITTAILGLSSIGSPIFWPDLGLFHKNKRRNKKRPIRVYMDGCFDLMHYGHANALRQAKSLGDELIVGIVSDEQIVTNKGPPVLSMEERLILVKGLKWVDEVIPDAPYEITEEFMNKLFNKYNIDYIIHGDDPCLLPDGTDAYASAKKVGRYKQIKRTEGVSSTDIVGRILSLMRHGNGDDDNKTDNNNINNNNNNLLEREKSLSNEENNKNNSDSFKTHLSHFLPTSRRIMQFSNAKGPSPNSRVVYIDGAFDLFHAGHVEILRSARELGDFLLVGIHDDQVLCEKKGKNPIMSLHERSLSVLACRYVDEIIIGAPSQVSKDMIATFNISLVVHGTVSESNSVVEIDPYIVPKSMGIFQTIKSPRNTTTLSVAKRIIDNLEAYKKRNLKKKASEDRYYSEKTFVVGD